MPRRKVGAPVVRISGLNTVGSVASEMRRVYQQAVREEITAVFAKSLISILAEIRTCIESHEVEQRLALLEAYITKSANAPAPHWGPRVVR